MSMEDPAVTPQNLLLRPVRLNPALKSPDQRHRRQRRRGHQRQVDRQPVADAGPRDDVNQGVGGDDDTAQQPAAQVVCP